MHVPPITTVPETAVWDVVASRQLRAATRDEHLASEAALDLASLTTPAALAAVLRGWLSVWQAVAMSAQEPSACSTARAELLGPAAQALDWLAVDVAELDAVAGHGGRRSGHQARATGTTATSGGDDSGGFAELLAVPSCSWGVAYVLGGSRLGGGVLAPMLSRAISLPDAIGTSFLRSVGTDPGRDWVAFRRRLDSVKLDQEQLISTIDAARWTFERVGAQIAARSREHPGVTS